jgi:uncharacterized protein YeeX (DUF496 family)
MNLFKFIWKYWTSSIFRKNIAFMIYRFENREELDKQFNEELEEIKQKTLARCKRQIDDLVYIKDHIDGGMALSKINELINELKEDYREIEKETI